VKLIYESKGVKGKYINAVSLYPTYSNVLDRYPVGHATKNCVETTQLHKALDIFHYFPMHEAHNMHKINY